VWSELPNGYLSSSCDEKEVAIKESFFDASHARFASIDLLLFMRSINPITYRRNAPGAGKAAFRPPAAQR
jgi:hypothetical protein